MPVANWQLLLPLPETVKQAGKELEPEPESACGSSTRLSVNYASLVVAAAAQQFGRQHRSSRPSRLMPTRLSLSLSLDLSTFCSHLLLRPRRWRNEQREQRSRSSSSRSGSSGYSGWSGRSWWRRWQAATQPDQFQHLATGGAGASVPWQSLSGCVSAGGVGHAAGVEGGTHCGKFISFISLSIIIDICAYIDEWVR